MIDLVETDFLLEFRHGMVAELDRRKGRGEFLKVLRENQPGHPHLRGNTSISEANHGEPLIRDDWPMAIIQNIEKRRAAIVVSNRDLLTRTAEQQTRLPRERVSMLIRDIRRQLGPDPPAPPPLADPAQNPMWYESATAPHHDCVACRTFMALTNGKERHILQDRLTAIVAIPGLRTAVFAALVWERITASA